MNKIISTSRADETEALAEKIGSRLTGGEVIELVSDVGGGKTTFVRGLARGIGSSDAVASPTFTISKRYDGKGIYIMHFDFYRLDQPGLIKHELSEYLTDEKAIIVIEWPQSVADILPAERITIHILQTNESDVRQISINAPENNRNIINAI